MLQRFNDLNITTASLPVLVEDRTAEKFYNSKMTLLHDASEPEIVGCSFPTPRHANQWDLFREPFFKQVLGDKPCADPVSIAAGTAVEAERGLHFGRDKVYEVGSSGDKITTLLKTEVVRFQFRSPEGTMAFTAPTDFIDAFAKACHRRAPHNALKHPFQSIKTPISATNL